MIALPYTYILYTTRSVLYSTADMVLYILYSLSCTVQYPVRYQVLTVLYSTVADRFYSTVQYCAVYGPVSGKNVKTDLIGNFW